MAVLNREDEEHVDACSSSPTLRKRVPRDHTERGQRAQAIKVPSMVCVCVHSAPLSIVNRLESEESICFEATSRSLRALLCYSLKRLAE